MSGHTPGPWSVIRDWIDDGDGSEIEVFDVKGPQEDDFLLCSIREADARLIAAAPDILEALQAAASDLFYQIEAKHGAKAASEYPSFVLAKAAIARAKG